MSLVTTAAVRRAVPTLAARTALLAGYSLCLAFGSAAVLTGILDLSMRDSSCSHILVIPFISLALFYRDRVSIFRTVEFAWRSGVGLIGAGFILYVVASHYQPPQDLLTLQMAVLLVLWTGGFVLIYGPHAVRAGLFPLLLLVLMLPIPSALLAAAIRVLTTGTAAVLGGLYTLTGTDYHRDASVFILSKVTIRIADECSGIRSTIALVIVGLVTSRAYLVTMRNRVLLLAAILPISIFKNAVRIATLTLLAIHVDPGFLTGRLHQQGGILFFVLGVGLVEVVLVVLRGSEQQDRAGLVSPGCAEHA